MKALDAVDRFKGELVEVYEKAFLANHEMLKPRDISDFYYFFTKVMCRGKS
jgi:hypothetical protein